MTFLSGLLQSRLPVCFALLQCVNACIDSTGNFYCASLWYFWFGLFWACIAMFVLIVCAVNHCNKKKRQVDPLLFPMPTPRPARTRTDYYGPSPPAGFHVAETTS